METVRRQRCETCAFHQAGATSSTGFCTNSAWQPSGGVVRFVRDRELACYGGWGIDYWKQRSGPLPTPPNPFTGPGGSSSGGKGGTSSGGGILSRYGTVAGGRIVQLRLIDPQAPTDLLIDEVTSESPSKQAEPDRMLGTDHVN